MILGPFPMNPFGRLPFQFPHKTNNYNHDSIHKNNEKSSSDPFDKQLEDKLDEFVFGPKINNSKPAFNEIIFTTSFPNKQLPVFPTHHNQAIKGNSNFELADHQVGKDKIDNQAHSTNQQNKKKKVVTKTLAIHNNNNTKKAEIFIEKGIKDSIHIQNQSISTTNNSSTYNITHIAENLNENAKKQSNTTLSSSFFSVETLKNLYQKKYTRHVIIGVVVVFLFILLFLLFQSKKIERPNKDSKFLNDLNSINYY